MTVLLMVIRLRERIIVGTTKRTEVVLSYKYGCD